MMTDGRRLVLPKHAVTKRWVKATDELRAYVKNRRDAIAPQVDSLTKERAELEGALAFLDQILPPRVAVPAGDPAAPVPIRQTSEGVPATRRADGQWSANFESCIGTEGVPCVRPDLPHVANGRCRSCDGRWRQSPAYALRNGA